MLSRFDFYKGQLDHKSTKNKILCHICLQDQSSKINSDAHVSTKIKIHSHFTRGPGGNSPQKPKKCKNGGFSFLHPILHTRPVLIWIQIRAREVRGQAPPPPGFFLLKWCNLVH